MNESEIDDRFLNVSPETLETIREYRRTHSPELIPNIVRGIVEKYLPADVGSRARLDDALCRLNVLYADALLHDLLHRQETALARHERGAAVEVLDQLSALAPPAPLR